LPVVIDNPTRNRVALQLGDSVITAIVRLGGDSVINRLAAGGWATRPQKVIGDK
jgi:hypothetical protein